MNSKLVALCVTATLLAGCHHERGNHENAEQSTKEIQAALDKWAKAFEAKDVNAVMAIYAPGDALTAFDLVPPLQYKGNDAYRKDYAEFFAQFDGPLHIDLSDPHTEVSGDLAVAYGLERISGRMKGGQAVNMWVRYTSAFKRIDGQWRDIHDHVSVPVDMATGRGALDLKP